MIRLSKNYLLLGLVLAIAVIALGLYLNPNITGKYTATLTGTGTINMTVTDKDKGIPIAANVELYKYKKIAGNLVSSQNTDSDGKATFTNLDAMNSPSNYLLYIIPTSTNLYKNKSTTTTLKEGETKDLYAKLIVKTTIITITVKGPGAGLDLIKDSAVSITLTPSNTIFIGNTLSNGKYSKSTKLYENQTATITVTKIGYKTKTETKNITAGTTNNITINLEKEIIDLSKGTVNVYIKDDAGNPIANTQVTVSHNTQPVPGSGADAISYSSSNYNSTMKTDSGGKAIFLIPFKYANKNEQFKIDIPCNIYNTTTKKYVNQPFTCFSKMAYFNENDIAGKNIDITYKLLTAKSEIDFELLDTQGNELDVTQMMLKSITTTQAPQIQSNIPLYYQEAYYTNAGYNGCLITYSYGYITLYDSCAYSVNDSPILAISNTQPITYTVTLDANKTATLPVYTSTFTTTFNAGETNKEVQVTMTQK